MREFGNFDLGALPKNLIEAEPWPGDTWLFSLKVIVSRSSLLIVGERYSDNGFPVSFIIELETGHRTIRHKSHMQYCIKSDKKIDDRRVHFGPC